MTKRTIASISSYVKAICDLNKKLKKDAIIHKAELLYRGQSNSAFELIPSIGRNRNSMTSVSIFNEERNLIEMAKFKLPDVFRPELTPVELLALLQHHGIPTRLLDVSENPLVALYFACKGSVEADGEVIIFKNENHEVVNFPILNALADSYRFASSTWTGLSAFYARVKTQPYFMEQKQRLDILHETNEVGGQWVAECCAHIIYLYAPIRSMRQQVQQGRYILFPNTIEKIGEDDCFITQIKPIPKEHKDIAALFHIPKENKQQLLEELALLGITESLLFCDSIDSVCKDITGRYQKKYQLEGSF